MENEILQKLIDEGLCFNFQGTKGHVYFEFQKPESFEKAKFIGSMGVFETVHECFNWLGRVTTKQLPNSNFAKWWKEQNKKEKFVIQPYDDSDKLITILEEDSHDWSGLYIEIDYDDVDHEVITKKANKLVNILNKYWNEEKENV